MESFLDTLKLSSLKFWAAAQTQSAAGGKTESVVDGLLESKVVRIFAAIVTAAVLLGIAAKTFSLWQAPAVQLTPTSASVHEPVAYIPGQFVSEHFQAGGYIGR